MGTRQNRLAEAVLTSTHNLCFEQKYENYQSFSFETFHFLVVKFLIYLNRRVFVMHAKLLVLSCGGHLLFHVAMAECFINAVFNFRLSAYDKFNGLVKVF